jgi:uncharacterized membrane-anchored protein YhcB (DUF1043 family)
MRVQRLARHFAAPGVVLLLGLATLLFGQVSVRQSTLNPNSPAQREMQAREWALTHIPDEVNKHFKKEQISLFAQIREDFTRLQLINNEMMRCIMSFIANPLFKQPNVVDAQLALKARRDLDLIVRLSKQLKTSLGDQFTDSTSLVVH